MDNSSRARLQAAFDARYVPVPEAGCWLWTGSQTRQGYGSYWDNGNHRAHRLSVELHRGPIPPGMDVCHKCDTPACVNPDHLFVGTRSDNMRDASNKKRLRGQRNTHCKRGHELTPENTKTRLINGKPSNQRGCLICTNLAAVMTMRKQADAYNALRRARNAALREATRAERLEKRRNAPLPKSGRRGVNLHGGRYIARIGLHGKTYNLGSFDDASSAAEAYNAAAIRLHGEFACLS